MMKRTNTSFDGKFVAATLFLLSVRGQHLGIFFNKSLFPLLGLPSVPDRPTDRSTFPITNIVLQRPFPFLRRGLPVLYLDSGSVCWGKFGSAVLKHMKFELVLVSISIVDFGNYIPSSNSSNICFTTNY